MTAKNHRNNEQPSHDPMPEALRGVWTRLADATQHTTPGRTATTHGPLSHSARKPASYLLIASALAASLLAAASLTACSQSGNDQADPTSPTSSQTRETDNRQPTDESDEPTDDDSTEPSDSSNAGYLCGGLLSEQFLKDELSFTPSPTKFAYYNRPPSDHTDGGMSCDLEDENSEIRLSINYTAEANSDTMRSTAEEAESNEDGDWHPLTIDGQEGKGWVRTGFISNDSVWVYPDGSGITVDIMTSGDDDTDREDEIADNLKALTENLVGNTPEHNETAGDVHASRG